jgi:hypothetical protein
MEAKEMNALSSVWYEFGKFDPERFDRFGTRPYTYQWQNPPPTAASLTNTRIIITPNDKKLAVNSTKRTAAPVAVVEKIDNTGFGFSAYNTGNIEAEAGFDFFAVAEVLQKRSWAPALRFGVSQPRSLGESATYGGKPVVDWGVWQQNFSKAFTEAEAGDQYRLLTAHNIGETGLRNSYTDTGDPVTSASYAGITVNGPRQYFVVAGVGVSCTENQDPDNEIFFVARNSDAVEGKVGFNWAVLKKAKQDDTDAASDVAIDSGYTPARAFTVHPNGDEWQYWEVQFNRSFTETPVVFVTPFSELSLPNVLTTDRYPPAVVGVVFNPTRFGFTLGARNPEPRPGQTGFFWIALGCGQGCG